ncbi:SubName: Full=Related to MON2-Peripheral membrane protein with a role in endocytosis and vacuole integrity {ECO:0000313/EMBL:CCA72019.1} [Serendipita indica DSM 11827]|nr:SubName: Full=Related to MON2-Peripheral membrane protein with a role in endocytosis and vacuole integrity {ECO:0000313/EMBL:CCA72019.1} [Serendipita indica DSM 11827]
MSSLSFLISELQALATETRRRYPDVREASDKAVALLRANPGAEGLTSLIDGAHGDDLMKPVFLGCASKNAKVITLALSVLQRLIALKAVSFRALPHIISTMGEIISQGVDIQLRILQALLSLVTTFPDLHGAVLGDALLLCFHLQDSRIAVVSSTAAATLRQLVMFIFEKVVMQKAAVEIHTIRLPDGTSTQLSSAELDAYRVFEDLCLLANAEAPQFLRLESLPKTFALELIESVLTNYHGLFHKRPEILLLLHHHLSPLLLKGLSERPLFPLALRSTRVVFLLLKQFSDELATEAEVFAMMLIRIISGEDSNASDGSRRPHWMRVLATEVIRGICNDADLMRRYWQLYDAGTEGSHVFAALITALKRLVTERPALLGVSHQMQGLGVHEGTTLEHVAGIVANAASSTVHGALGIPNNATGLNMETCSMRLQCIDQLDKAEAPAIPEGYIYVLGLQCLVSIAEGFAASTLPAFALLSPKGTDSAPMRLPPALDLDALDGDDATVKHLRVEKRMIEDGWPALLAALSFLIGTNLSDELFSEVLAALQALTNVSGVLGLQTPRDAFLTSLSKLAIPARVVSRLDSHVEPSTPRGAAGVVDGIAALAGASVPIQTPGLSDRNVACLKVLIFSASYLGGSLGPSWFNVLETLQNADYVLTNKGTRIISSRKLPSALLNASIGKAASGTSTTAVEPAANGYHLDRPLLLTDVEPEHVLMAIQGLFESTKDMSDEAFNHFTVALCKLSAEMIGMQVSADLDESLQEDANGPPMSPTAAYAHRRRVSGIQLTRTPRSGDFSVNKLGTISQLNISRLLYLDESIAWQPITSHLMTILRHPLAPASLRIQAAQNLDGVLVVIPRALQNLDKETIKTVQQRTLTVLASQVTTEGGSSTVVDIRRMGLETLHQILQTGSHTLLVGWEIILEMLASVCRPTTAPTSIPMVPEDSIPETPIVPTTPHTRGTPSLNTGFLDKPNIP